MKRRSEHIKYIYNTINELNNEIGVLCRKMTFTKDGDFQERFFITKIRIKTSLVGKYSRRLKTLSI